MRDCDIRIELDARLLFEHGNEPGTRIRHELGLCAGQRRVDVALINGELTGYEIKSDEDTLFRLAGQAETYGLVLDKAVLVTTQRHLDRAIDHLPEWWGVMVARTENRHIRIEVIRDPTLNQQHDPFALAQLLWRDEAFEELKVRGFARGLGKKARYYVWQALAEAIPLEELRAVVRTRLKERQEWSGGELRVPSGATSPIEPTL